MLRLSNLFQLIMTAATALLFASAALHLVDSASSLDAGAARIAQLGLGDFINDAGLPLPGRGVELSRQQGADWRSSTGSGFTRTVMPQPHSGPLNLISVIAGVLVAAGLVVMLLAVAVARFEKMTKRLVHLREQACFLARHDPLTRIPNRAYFDDRLKQLLESNSSSEGSLALHLIDLDRFKQINHHFGHNNGDQLVAEVARRIVGVAGKVENVARLGGDEFAIIQTGAADAPVALLMAQRIVESLGQAFHANGQEIWVGASVGVSIVSVARTTPEEAMRRSSAALRTAKNEGRGRCQLFDEDVTGYDLVQDLTLENDLREALKYGCGLAMAYQPIFNAESREMAGAEALARWLHPDLGPISPGVFIRLAEERGLINQLGQWALRSACAQALQSNLPWVAVNVSPVQLHEPGFADMVFEALAECGLDPWRLEVEITEGLLLQLSPVVQGNLDKLRNSGIRIALDDFGTGHSSITYLINMRVDKLKIDQSFVAQLGTNREVDAIVSSIIDIGRALDICVTAEGVETEEQLRVLQTMGCELIQGYLLSKPVSGDRLADRW